MKTTLISALLLLGSFVACAQQMRYFEFRTQCGYNEWRDTTFIAATSDVNVIADVLNDLTKPVEQRKLIIGFIEAGNGGFNRNGSHWFSWHFQPGQWHLQEFAMEVCDGCPYTDIDLNPDYWINQIGEFCPWTSSVSREVTHLVGLPETTVPEIGFFPNPAHGKITLETEPGPDAEVRILNTFGTVVKTVGNSAEIDLSRLPAGHYFLAIKQQGKLQIQKLILE